MTVMGPVSGQATTLANSIIGVGILAMPFCFKQCGIVLSIVMLVGSGFMSRLSCHFLLKSSIMSRRRNFESLAFHVFGSTGKFAVEIGIIGFLMGTCIAYFVVVGDLGPQIIAKMFDLNESDNLRTAVMVVVSLVCVLPLGLLRNVDSLSNVCVATIGFYFCLVVKVVIEATNQILSGEWLDKVEYWQPAGVLQCLPIFSMALFCQTQLFEIYDTVPGVTLDKMNSIVKNAISICSGVYVLVGLFGYIAFCNQPFSGNVLMSFSPTMASDAIKMGFVLSLAFSFPLIIFPCRASLYSLLFRKGQCSPHELLNNLIPEKRFRCITVGIVALSLVLGLMLPNIELVLGLVGSTIGVIVCVIFPATCFICVTSKNTNERILAQIVLCFGIIIMVLGTYANLQAAEVDSIRLENKLAAAAEQEHAAFIESKLQGIVSPDSVLKDGVEKFAQIESQILGNNLNSALKPGINKIEDSVIKIVDLDSRFEPPNPVPPKEDVTGKNIIVETASDINKLKEGVKNKIIDVASKDDKEGGGDREVQPEVQPEVNTERKIPVIPNIVLNKSPLVVEVNLEENVHKDNLEEKAENNKKTIGDFKQQALMESMKRHENEQKEMIKEQKKILQEMKDTKIEMEREGILQKVDKLSRASIENKKIALESIQKLAKLAIESLAADLEDTTSEKESKKNYAKPKLINEILPSVVVQQNNASDMKEVSLPSVADNKLSPNDGHVHKEDEPESYKAGEDMIKVKPENKVVDEVKVKNDYLNRPPIPIALLKTGEENKKPGNIINVERPPDTPNIINNKPQNVENQKPKENSDYVGGKRDILEVHTERTVTQEETSDILLNKGSVHNIREKRDVSDCIGIVTVNSEGLRICKGRELGKLSASKK